MALVTTMPDLLTRYDELKSKTQLSKDENEELNSVISRITTMVPGAVTQWDRYGNAISISTGKVKEFIKEQKALLRYQNKSAIEETKNNISDYKKKLKNAQDAYAQGGETVIQTNPMFGGSTSYVDSRSIPKLEKQIKEYGTLLQGAEAKLQELQGDTLEKTIESNRQQSDANSKFLKMTRRQLEQWLADKKNANDKYRELAQSTLDSKTDSSTGDNINGEKKKEKAIKAAFDKQSALYEEAQLKLKEKYLQGNSEQLQTQSAFNEEMEKLRIQDLNARLAIMGLEPEQRRQIEQQLLDIKIKALEDFRKRKAAIEAEDKDDLTKGNQKALAANKTWMDQQMKNRGEMHEQEVMATRQATQEMINAYEDYGNQVGESIGQMIAGEEDSVRAFGQTMLNILFDVLQQIILSSITELTASATKNIGKATMEAAATPDSVLTFGATAAGRTAIITGLITGALAAAQAALTSKLKKPKADSLSSSSSGSSSYTRVSGRESGGYIDVVRSQDSKSYPNTSFSPGQRGFISRPTVIVGEGAYGQSKEWVASNAAVENPTIAPILNILDKAQQAGTIRTLDLTKYIQAVGITGRANGGTISHETNIVPTATQFGATVAKKLLSVLEKLETDGLQSYVILDELDKQQRLRDKSRKIGSK